MNMIDNDLISIQEARILAENAVMAKKQLAEFSQEKLDRIVEGMLNAVFPYLAELAWMSHEETGYGKVEDKIAKNYFVCEAVRRQIRDMKCVGFIEEEKDQREPRKNCYINHDDFFLLIRRFSYIRLQSCADF